MAITTGGNVWVCTGTTTITGPVDIAAVKNDATTSASIAHASSSVVMWNAGAGSGAIVSMPLRSAAGIVVTVTGGGSVTLYLRTQTEGTVR